MGVAIPQVITEDRAAAASVATGSFVFPDTYGHHKLSRYVPSSGNTGTYTVSMWVKLNQEPTSGQNPLWSASPTLDNNNYYGLYIGSDQLRYHNANASTTDINGSNKLRDRNSWYHIHTKVDSNTAQCYINGEAWGGTFTLNGGWWNNSSYRMDIGSQAINNGVTGSVYAAYQYAQVYNIDGQAVGPEYFGHTDPLTGVWSPKPFDISDTPGGSWGTNGFYLPMDGKVSVVKDLSPNDIKFVTTYFTSTSQTAAGSLSNHVPLDKATGAIPILKTDPSGQVMTGGPRTDRRSFKVTVVSTDEGNKFFLNGERVSPGSLQLYRGGLYTFDQSDASNGTGGTHPFRFATAADAAGSTEYTDGVTQGGTPGSTGAYTEIIVPHNAPDTLYYYCTNHGGMGGPIANTTDVHVADPYAWKLQLAVAFNSKNTSSADRGMKNWASGYTNYTVDSSGSASGRTMAVGPDIYLLATGTSNIAYDYNFYGGSKSFDGPDGTTGGDYIRILGSGTDAGDALAFGTDDFTVEFWANFEDMGADSSSAVLSTSTSSQNAGSWIIGFHGSAGSASFGWCYDVPNFTWLSARIDGYFHSWHHYVFQREGGTFKIFIDGVQATHNNDSVNYNYVASQGKIGQRWINSDAYSLNAEIQDLRVYKGVAKYNNIPTGSGNVAFLCPSTKPYFLPEVPKGTPYPGTLKKIEGGAVHFPYRTGSNTDYLEIADSTDFDLGSGDFTIECFFYVDRQQQNYGTFCGKIDSGFSIAGSSFVFRQELTNRLQFVLYSGSTAYAMVSTQHNFQEFSWNHAAVTREGNKLYMYVNGHLESTNDLGSALSMNNTSNPIQIGGANPWASSGFGGYISNLRIVKGTAVYTSQYPPFAGPTASFTPPTGPLENAPGTVLLCCQSTTSAAEATVSPGAITVNGSAGSTNFSPFINNILQMQGPENNYAVLEATRIKTHQVEVNNGGLELHGGTGSPWNTFPGTMGASSGKWYWEVYAKNTQFSTIIGAAQDGSYHMWDTDVYPGQSSYGNSFGIQNNGTLRVNGTSTGSWVDIHAATNLTKPTIGFALDMDNGKAYISINGVWGPDSSAATNGMVSDGTATAAATGLTGTYRPVIAVNGGTYNWDTLEVNFGQRPFRYAPPEGYKCWNRTNLPTPEKVARNATKNFVPYLWSGTQTGSGGALSYKDIGFQPDFIWVKQRNQAYSTGHQLYDSVRGFASDKEISSEGTAAQGAGNIEDYGWINGTYENGFITKGGSTNYDYVNKSGDTYVAWCWSAPESFSNTAGSNGADLACTGKRNVDAGFSIVSWTSDGGTGGILHGLNRMPELVLMKPLNGGSWAAQFYGSDNVWYTGNLNTSNALPALGSSNQATATLIKNFGFGAGPMIAYCWHSVEGYCKVGSFIGNGSTSGPVIYTEFKPTYVILKGAAGARNWLIYTVEVDPTNPTGTRLVANVGNSEGTYASQYLDILSNGFKLRGDDSDVNQGGETFFYMAFAEAPTNAGFGAVINAR